MLRQALSEFESLATLSRIAMLMFFVCFLLIVGYALLCSRRQIEDWSAMPLSDGQPKGTSNKGVS